MKEERRIAAHRMDFYPHAFIASCLTAGLTGEETALYAMTLLTAWSLGARLPAKPEEIRKAVNYSSESFAALWPAVAPKWQVRGRWRTNRKLSDELKSTVTRIAKARTSGRLGGLQRAANIATYRPSDPQASLNLSSSSSSSSSSSTKEEKKEHRGRFAPPSVEEVREYVQEKGHGFDPEAFVAFYVSNGWKVGRHPMKDWRAACVTWQKRQSASGKALVGANSFKATAEQAAELEKIRREFSEKAEAERAAKRSGR